MKRLFAALLAALLFAAGSAFGQVYTNPYLTGVDTGSSIIGLPVIGGTANRVLYIDSTGNLANSGGLTFNGTGITIASGTIVDSAPGLTITQTWNDATEAFVGASMNITKTAALNTSLIQRWQVGGVDVASVGLGQAGTNGVIAVHAATTPGASVVAFTAATAFPATAITTAEGFRSTPTMADGSGVTYAQAIGFKATNAVKSGASDTITKQVGFSVGAAFNVGTSNYGFEGTIAVSGSSRYNLYMSGTAPNHLLGPLLLGGDAAVLTASSGSWAATKITASASAPGAAGAKFEVVCGTNAGTAKVIVYAGTSATAVTMTDNIGAGVTGC